MQCNSNTLFWIPDPQGSPPRARDNSFIKQLSETIRVKIIALTLQGHDAVINCQKFNATTDGDPLYSRLSGSHTRSVWSELPEINRPSFNSQTQLTHSLCPRRTFTHSIPFQWVIHAINGRIQTCLLLRFHHKAVLRLDPYSSVLLAFPC